MSFWPRKLKRLFPARSKPVRLDRCEACDGPFTYPVSWGEADTRHWWISLRCGACGAERDTIVTDEVAQDFDRRLDSALDEIERAADVLAFKLMSEEADMLAAAFDRDLIDVEDFRR